MNVWLDILIGVLGVAAGLTVREVAETFRPRHHNLAPVIDLSAAAARGDLLHLDWADQRPPPTPVKPAEPTWAP